MSGRSPTYRRRSGRRGVPGRAVEGRRPSDRDDGDASIPMGTITLLEEAVRRASRSGIRRAWSSPDRDELDPHMRLIQVPDRRRGSGVAPRSQIPDSRHLSDLIRHGRLHRGVMERSNMAGVRYELRVSGLMSDRARDAFSDMIVNP
jgi:hypothetical protein